ncbi:MAG: hypothetical protein Q8934_17100 [Bacillota bacterium]|nr:hypothetical protein [Bacillota bacterium]
MKQRLMTVVITLLILFGASYGITHYTKTRLVDYSFVVGLVVTVIIWFFTSKGGYTSRSVDMVVQGLTGIKAEKQKYEFSPNVAFFTSLAYTLISFIVMMYHYRSYF